MTGPGPGVRLHAPLKTTHQDALYYNNKIIQTYPPLPVINNDRPLRE